jgi:hypothetical protein
MGVMRQVSALHPEFFGDRERILKLKKRHGNEPNTNAK